MRFHRKQFTDEIQQAFEEVTGDFLNKRVSAILIDVFARAITNSLVKGNSVRIRGFGEFQVRYRNAKAYPNPNKQGEKVIKPPTVYVAFSAGKELTKAVKGTFNHESEKNFKEDD